MNLAADIARCVGHEDNDGNPIKECQDCRRRTDRSTFPLNWWMAPLEFEQTCEMKIEPEGT